MEQNRSWEVGSGVATQEFPKNFVEYEGSLPCSQGPSTSPYPKSDQASPYHPILSL
jgi:hypothetical protein